MNLCSICLNEPINKQTINCGHEFCRDCIVKWSITCFENNVIEFCPNCRSVLYYEKENNDLNETKHDNFVHIDLFILFVFLFGFLNIVNKPIYQFWLSFIILFFAIILLDKLMIYNYS